MNALTKFFQHNWLATLYLNFRMLPFRQAIHLPLDVSHRVRFESLRGKIVLDETLPLHRAMVRIGGRGSDMFPRTQTVLCIDGKVLLRGDKVEIGHGVSLIVGGQGTLTLGEKVRIGAMSKVYCSQAITMGNEIDLSWECQVFDTNFHQMQNTETGDLVEPAGEVRVGDNVWVGNRCTIGRDCVLPDDVIVASNSLLNKDYSAVSPYSLLAGMPAQVVKTGVRRIFEQR